jgi:hypothetical protein
MVVVPRLSWRTALLLSWLLLLCNGLHMCSTRSSSKGKEFAAARRRRDAQSKGSGASRWSDMQKGRRQDYSTLKSRGYSKDLELQEEGAGAIGNELRKLGQIDSESIAEAVGAMPVVCPFDTQINCGPNKMCPTDGRPCSSSRHYFFPSASADTLPPTLLNAFSDSVGRLVGPPDFPETAHTGDEGELTPSEETAESAADLNGADERAWARALRWISGLFGRRGDDEQL